MGNDRDCFKEPDIPLSTHASQSTMPPLTPYSNITDQTSLVSLHDKDDWESTTIEAKNDGKRRFCNKCEQYKPDRCHHCSICDRCVLKMDHHCKYIHFLNTFLILLDRSLDKQLCRIQKLQILFIVHRLYKPFLYLYHSYHHSLFFCPVWEARCMYFYHHLTAIYSQALE